MGQTKSFAFINLQFRMSWNVQKYATSGKWFRAFAGKRSMELKRQLLNWKTLNLQTRVRFPVALPSLNVSAINYLTPILKQPQ